MKNILFLFFVYYSNEAAQWFFIEQSTGYGAAPMLVTCIGAVLFLVRYVITAYKERKPKTVKSLMMEVEKHLAEAEKLAQEALKLHNQP